MKLLSVAIVLVVLCASVNFIHKMFIGQSKIFYRIFFSQVLSAPSSAEDISLDKWFDDEPDQDESRMKCIINAIDDAVKSTDFNKVWEEYKNDLKNLEDRIKDCKNHWVSSL